MHRALAVIVLAGCGAPTPATDATTPPADARMCLQRSAADDAACAGAPGKPQAHVWNTKACGVSESTVQETSKHCAAYGSIWCCP
jgi:hypothetical protein